MAPLFGGLPRVQAPHLLLQSLELGLQPLDSTEPHTSAWPPQVEKVEPLGRWLLIRWQLVIPDTTLLGLALRCVDGCRNLAHRRRCGAGGHVLARPAYSGGKREGGRKEKKGEAEEKPSLGDLERYVEMMYEDTEQATKATYMILQLARQPENLEGLLESEALLGLLARLLQEEGPKSMDLAINIIYILYSFSNFSQFHQMLYQARVGHNVLEVVELEAKRHRVREHEREKKGKGDAEEEKRRLREETIQREHAERFNAKEEENTAPAAAADDEQEEEVVYQKKPKRKRRVVVVQDSSSEEEIEVKLPKPKKDATQSAEDDLYRRTYARLFEVH